MRIDGRTYEAEQRRIGRLLISDSANERTVIAWSNKAARWLLTIVLYYVFYPLSMREYGMEIDLIVSKPPNPVQR